MEFHAERSLQFRPLPLQPPWGSRTPVVYNDTEIEPHLQETENHVLQQRVNPQDKSRSDIRENGFNPEFQNSFLDVKVINIQAKSHEKHSVAKALEQAKD